MSAKQALKKLEEQLNCPICLDTYTDPKLLPCHHVYCRKCLVKLVIRDQQGDLVLTCPHCRHVIPVPPNGVTGFPSAFHVNYLLEIQESFRELQIAPVSVEGAVGGECSSLNAVRKASYCSEHSEKELELYCETCGKLICCYCAIKGGKHRNHDHEILKNADEKYRKVIASSFAPMEKHLLTVKRAVAKVNTQCEEVTAQETDIKTNIHDTMRRLREILYVRETFLIDQLHQMSQAKLKELAVQKDQLETTQAQLSSCLECMAESLKSEGCGEEVKTKATIAKQIQELPTVLQPETLEPKASAGIKFFVADDFTAVCHEYGKLSVCTGKVLSTPSFVISNLASPWGVTGNLKGEIFVSEGDQDCVSVFSSSGVKLRSFGSHGSEEGQFNTPRGMAVDGEGNILVVDQDNHRIQKFTTAGEFLSSIGRRGSGPLQFESPKDICINPKNGKVYIVDENGRIQILNSDLSFFGTFGMYGADPEQLCYPCGVACDSSGKVYVADSGNNRIQVFTPELELVRLFSKRLYSSGGKLRMPIGISVDSNSGLVYISEFHNHCVSVFTTEGRFVTYFGRPGRDLGEFSWPGSLAVINGVLYVCGRDNNRVQAFS